MLIKHGIIGRAYKIVRVETWMDNTTISGNWCSFIRFQGTTIGVNNYNGIIYIKPYGKDLWFKIECTLIS